MNQFIKLSTVFLSLCLWSCNSSSTPSKGDKSPSLSDLSTKTSNLNKTQIVIKTTYGNIAFKLYPNKAPATVKRILELTKKGFYNGHVFHRVIAGFVIQTGDPTGTGRGGSGKNLKAEFNDIPHIKGTVAMARAQDINSADSQFYIALGTIPHLDKKYTVFGQVTEGLNLISKVKKGDKIITMVVKE